MKIYHVAPEGHQGDLISLYDQYGEPAYDMYADRWPDAGDLVFVHAHYVHCYATIEQARDHIHDGVICEIDATDLEVVIDDLEFPHPMVEGVIDASLITIIE
jgi:hypothetical protein